MKVLVNGCLAMGALAILAMLVIFGGTTALTDNLVEWRAAGIPLDIAKVEATREAHTVDVSAEVAIALAELNADTAVTLAEISADTTKKTDTSFIFFYLVRAGLWTIGGLAVLYLILRVLVAGGERE